MPAIYHEGSWLGNATDPEVLVKDTVGWTGKNRAYSQTNNAVIAHIENGITYDVSWTGSATVTLKKNSTSGATITSGSTSPLSFTADADYELYFGSSATVTNIMVKDSRITDSTYEPYHESVQNQLNAQGVLGAKNLIQNKATTQTFNGVTFTVNADGSVNVNGTATADAYIVLDDGNMAFDTSNTYILSGTPVLTGLDLYIHHRNADNTAWIDSAHARNGSEAIFSPTISGTRTQVAIWVTNGTVVSNLVFYPMLRLASDPDDTYQPYAMTNRELTEKVFEKRTLTSSDDLNNITETGIYHITTSPANAPDSMTYCTLLVSRRDNTDIQQVIYRAADNIGLMYIRAKGGNPSTWKPWYKFAGTVVS